MKKIAAVTVVICMLFSLFPGSVFASDSSLTELLEKLQNLVTEETTEDVPSDSDAGNGVYTPKELYDRTAPSVVEITIFDENDSVLAQGSGFFINDRGDIVTNYHVIDGAYSADVKLMNGDEYSVQYVLAYDRVTDLAVLRIDLQGNAFLTAAREPVATGDTIYTLGSALGLTGTFSDGLVSTASRVIGGVDYIQITAPISSGNSGGPLINSLGEVAGINSLEYTEGQNVNFAVNIQELTRLDFSSPLTMPQLFEKEAANRKTILDFGTDDPEILSWLADADVVEAESNDELENADVLPDDYWMAGSIKGTEDFDCYGIIVTEAAPASIVILPYYEEDADYILAALADDKGNILAYSEKTEYEEAVFDFLEADLEEGTYYLVVCVPDDYPYSEPAFYQVSAVW